MHNYSDLQLAVIVGRLNAERYTTKRETEARTPEPATATATPRHLVGTGRYNTGEVVV